MYFFEYLGVIIRIVIELYVYNIFLNFNYMLIEVILNYLKYIKDIIIFYLKYFLNKKSKKYLLVLEELLCSIVFIFVECYRLVCVSEFFNLYKEMFKIENWFCCLFEFFLFLYDEYEWEEFLVYCGMKNDVIFDIFLDFVNCLERLVDLDGIIIVVIENFKWMVIIFFFDLNLFESYFL